MAREDDVTVLTGATGFVGSLVLERLLARGDRVAALVRARDDADARRRLEQLAEATWGDATVVAGVQVLAADVERDGLGLAPDAYDALAERAAAVVHCAASIRFDLSLDDAHAINVAGTERIVALAERARERGAAGRLVHVSTAYVHGRADGLARETGPAPTPAFRNTYEKTKHRAERVVERLDGAAIVRPSIVVGDTRTGWTSSFNVVYPPLRALVSGVLDVVPAPAGAILDLVPVDHVVEVVAGLLDDPAQTGVVQVVSGELAPTMEQFARLSLEHAGRPMMECVPTAADQIGVYAPYVDVWARFEFARAGQLGVRPVPIERLVPLLLDHAAAARWGRTRVLRSSPVGAASAAA
ncbi:SDR family oxidoreductase [Conexibacter sp. CPCC 206217]|uniref:SDR family oxidoreductase n=1 Tax=Conexibacter sp. CPCC 206217 TaxID=3064574 RepID=UPI002724C94C|nr:SDR family oxidoreductase [Conexibacter sp. CPCC 206217]MDO8213297.1 SDR family oxidoreductase [Conexibacter sp. CPCC 206217]